jgi:hypothetical protein
MSSLTRARQDAAMHADHEAGLTWPQVAAKYEISRRTAQRRVAAHQQAMASDGAPDRPTGLLVLRIDPVAEIIDMVASRERIATQLEAIASSTTHDGYKIAALMRLDEIKERRIALLQACGLMPVNLGLPRAVGEVQSLVREMHEVLSHAPEEMLHDCSSSPIGCWNGRRRCRAR